MATFEDNIKTIGTAVYGKEMRPAIAEALTQSWDAVKIMTGAVESLNARIDALNGGGGTPAPTPSDNDELLPTILVVNGTLTALENSGAPS